MNFHIDIVEREIVAGWLTPDNPSVCPRFIVEVPGREPVEFDANMMRPDILDLGWHSTGMVGFSIDETLVPELPKLDSLAIVDFHTGVTIFRRDSDPSHLPEKVMLFDCSMMPQWRLHNAVGRHFSILYPSIDRHPLETSLAILWNIHLHSAFVTGAPNYLRYISPLNVREFKCVALLRDPFDELAERLLFLNALARMPKGSSIRVAFSNYEELVDHFAAADFSNRRSLVALLRALEGNSRELLRSPVTRTFGAEVGEGVSRKNVPVALDNLSKLAFVGFRDDFDVFGHIVDTLVGTPLFTGAELSAIPGTKELAQILSKVGPAIDLIEEDLALYAFAREAVSEIEIEHL